MFQTLEKSKSNRWLLQISVILQYNMDFVKPKTLCKEIVISAEMDTGCSWADAKQSTIIVKNIYQISVEFVSRDSPNKVDALDVTSYNIMNFFVFVSFYEQFTE